MKYRPSNGTEGMWFQSEFCDHCLHDAKYRETGDGEDGCKILADSYALSQFDPDYPEELTCDWDGPVMTVNCTAFVDQRDAWKHYHEELERNGQQKLPLEET